MLLLSFCCTFEILRVVGFCTGCGESQGDNSQPGRRVLCGGSPGGGEQLQGRWGNLLLISSVLTCDVCCDGCYGYSKYGNLCFIQ